MSDASEAVRSEVAAPGPVPVTLLTGFLGSGKTTLLNRLLTGPFGHGTAVIVNEFGELPIDGRLVTASDEEVVELANGCICCTVRGDLVRTVKELFARRAQRGARAFDFQRIVIESSGLASPGPVHQTFRLDDELRARTRPCGIVTLCHAGLLEQQVAQYREAAEQVGFADVIVLNHADTVDAAGLDSARASLRRINSFARIHVAVRAELDDALLLDQIEPAPERWQLMPDAIEQRHTSDVRSYSLVHDAPIDLHRLKIWLQLLAARRDWEVMRIKGILRGVGRSEPVVVQAVHQYLELGPGTGAAPLRSILVVIGRSIDEAALREGWARVATL